MKTLKNLFLLCAGLSLCACNSDNEPQLIEGTGALTVKVSLPTTRTVDESPNDGSQTVVTGDIYVVLTCGEGTKIEKITDGTEVTFWGITSPTKVEAYVNGGKYVNDNFNTIEIDSKKTDDANALDGLDNYNMQADAEGVPAYGYVTSTVGGAGAIQETNEEGYNGGKSYKMYKAAITMTIPVARIEFDVTYDFNSTKFTSLDFQGVYLDNIKLTPNLEQGVSPTNNWDYRHANDVDKKDGETLVYATTATGASAKLYNYEGAPISFTTTKEGTLPKVGAKYAYNIYPGATPYIKLWFNNAASSSYVLPYQYAVVNSYKDGGADVTFEPGYIYRVTNLVLTESNLATKEDGTDVGVEYAIQVNVTRAQWNVLDVTGSWTKP